MSAVDGSTSDGPTSDRPAWAHAMYDFLCAEGVTQIAYVPDAGLRVMINRSLADAEVHSIPLTTEEEGVALLAGADLGGMPHHRHQIPMAAGFDAQHAEAALGAVEGDPLDRAGQHFGGLGCGVRHPGGLASDWLVHASPRCHRAMLTGCCNAHLSC